MKLILLLTFVALTAPAATRDFLTAEEIDQVRLAQEPSVRVQTYLKFAQLRIAQLNQLAARDRPGRSALMHDLLEDYTGITDALSTVIDDAIRRKADLTKGIVVVIPGERALLMQLEAIEDSHPADIARYEFVLKDAIGATQDVLGLMDDLGGRAREISEKDQRDDLKRKESLSPEDAERRETERAKQEKATRKPPTLRRSTDPPAQPH
jgi:hypothetical protein